jgi:glutamate-1-semialdehyde 2,1-aminomutase
MSERYKQSETLLERALQSIPLGTQTFSKSKTQYPYGVSPFFIKRGQGSHVWDVDGNEYIDFVNSLAAITLGYSDPEVDAAVVKQLKDGIIFSLPHPVEMQVAEMMIEMIPCAEAVRFGKNGSDATAGAVRLARAFTGREHVIVCGYHGWQDWYIGSTQRRLGVPKCVSELTHQVAYNDLAALEALFCELDGKVATLIMEPMNVVEPKPGYLAAVKELTHKNGALLTFDETVTGFRYASGGAQEYFNVIPDLATFGKGLANGYPLAAIVGRKDVMKLLEEIFFSFTFGGETLSLAAALATMTKFKRENVTQKLAVQGAKVFTGASKLIEKHQLQNVIEMSGHATWNFLNFKNAGETSMWQIKTLFLQEVFARGILTLGSHNMCYAHSNEDIEKLLKTYDEVFAILQKAIKSEDFNSSLKCKVLEPLFKIR